MGLTFERGKLDFDLVLTGIFSGKLQDNLKRSLRTSLTKKESIVSVLPVYCHCIVRVHPVCCQCVGRLLPDLTV